MMEGSPLFSNAAPASPDGTVKTTKFGGKESRQSASSAADHLLSRISVYYNEADGARSVVCPSPRTLLFRCISLRRKTFSPDWIGFALAHAPPAC